MRLGLRPGLAVTMAAALGGGIVTAYSIAPGRVEITAIQAREGKLSDAETRYRALIRQLGPQRDLVIPLIELEQSLGDDKTAENLFRDYVKAHPKDFVMARRYADFLGADQHLDERIALLAQITQTTKNISDLRTLGDLYALKGDEAKRGDVLLQIAEDGRATFNDLIEASQILASQGALDRALAISQRALQTEPAKATLAAVETQVALADAVKRPDLAKAALVAWRADHDNAAGLLQFARDLESAGHSDLAFDLIANSQSYASGDSQLRLEVLTMQSAGDPARAFASLLDLKRANKLPPAALPQLVSLGLNLGRYSETFTAVSDIKVLPDATQIALIDAAGAQNRKDLLQHWRDQTGTGWQILSPIAAIHLALALEDRKQAAALATQLLKSAKTDGEIAQAAAALSQAGEREAARSAVQELARKPIGSLNSDALEPLAQAALDTGETATAKAAAQRLATIAPGPDAKALYARALVATGNAQEALGVLSGADNRIPVVETATLAALRAAGEKMALQNLVFQRLADTTMSRARRNDLLNALVDSAPLGSGGAEIVPSLVAELGSANLSPDERKLRVRALAMISPAAAMRFANVFADSSSSYDVSIYADLLARAGRKDEAVKALLAAAERAQTRQDKIDFMQDLTKLGAESAALPLLASFAQKEGGDWYFAYEDALKTLGQHDQLAAALVRHAADPTANADTKRGIAFELVDMGHKAEAVKIFQDLAQSEGPSSKDTETLMWLWGPRPEPPGIAWMVQTAHGAKPQDRAIWIDKITDAGAPRDAANLAEQFKPGINDLPLLEATARAYAAVKDRGGLEHLLSAAAPQIPDAASAERLAEAAQQGGADYPATLLFERAATLDPKRIDSLKGAGITAMAEGMTTRAGAFLQSYADHGGHDTEAIFTLAEIDLAANRKAKANNGFEQVVDAIDPNSSDLWLKRRRALALLRLGRKDEAQQIFEALLKERPDDAELRANLAEALRDANDPVLARQYLDTSHESEPH